MLDVWMLFILFLPFSQVLILVFVGHLHKENETKLKPPYLSEVPFYKSIKKTDILLRVERIMIPLLALVFTLTFFVIGLIIYGDYGDFLDNLDMCDVV